MAASTYCPPGCLCAVCSYASAVGVQAALPLDCAECDVPFPTPHVCQCRFCIAGDSHIVTKLCGQTVVVPSDPARFGWSGLSDVAIGAYVPTCPDCKKELSAYLDAYYGHWEVMKKYCSNCRRKYDREDEP